MFCCGFNNSVRPIISKSTGPIFAKLSGRQNYMAVGDESEIIYSIPQGTLPPQPIAVALSTIVSEIFGRWRYRTVREVVHVGRWLQAASGVASSCYMNITLSFIICGHSTLRVRYCRGTRRPFSSPPLCYSPACIKPWTPGPIRKLPFFGINHWANLQRIC